MSSLFIGEISFSKTFPKKALSGIISDKMDKFTNYINPNDRVDVFAKEGEEFTRFFAFYKGRQKDSLIISIPQNTQKSFDYKSGQDLIVNIYTKGGIYRHACKLLFCDNQNCYINIGEDFERVQRREYIRVNMPVEFELHLTSQTKHEKTYSITKNISGKGLNANLKTNISPYPKVEIILNFGDKKIKTLSRIVKIKNITTKEGEFFNTSLEFISISEKEIDYIVKKCFEYETSERRKMLNS